MCNIRRVVSLDDLPAQLQTEIRIAARDMARRFAVAALLAEHQEELAALMKKHADNALALEMHRVTQSWGIR